MITNNFNKELRGISDALRDLGYTDSTIGLRQRYWKEYCFLWRTVNRWVFSEKMNTFFLHRMVPDTVSQQWTQRLGIFFLGLVFHTAAREKVHGCMT